jgi:electron-transferring-flavoprotein dehydrogenase
MRLGGLDLSSGRYQALSHARYPPGTLPMSDRESMPVDVVIVGAGPSGLAAAIRLKQLDADLEVVVLEKGSEVGAHILSGAVIDPRALDELLPKWRESCPLAAVPVTENRHWLLTRTGKWEMPHLLLPPLMSNEGELHRLARELVPLAR